MQGEVVKYMVANGFTEFDQPKAYNDVSPYQSFDGGSISDLEMGESSDFDWSNATGKRRKKKKAKSSTIKSRMEARQKARAERKDRKLKIKESEVATQKKVAEDLSKEDPSTQKLMETLAQDDKKTESTTGMSKGLKIGLIVGGVVVAGVIAIVVIRKMKKKK
jgi:hypothetical protein